MSPGLPSDSPSSATLACQLPAVPRMAGTQPPSPTDAVASGGQTPAAGAPQAPSASAPALTDEANATTVEAERLAKEQHAAYTAALELSHVTEEEATAATRDAEARAAAARAVALISKPPSSLWLQVLR